MITKKTILAIISIIVISCENKNKDNFIIAFDKLPTEKLTSKPVTLKKSELFFNSMFDMVYANDLIFISEIQDSEYEMKIVDLKKSEIFNFAKRGRGPNEVRSRGCSFSVDYSQNELYVIDRNVCLIYSIDSLKNGNFSNNRKIDIELNKALFLRATYCSGNIVGTNNFGELLGVYNTLTNDIVKTDTPNKDKLSEGTLNNQMFFVNHPSKSKVANFHHKSGINGIINVEFPIINISENYYWSNKSKEILNGSESRIEHSRDERNGFIHATADDNYIYALYSGEIMNDARTLEKLTQKYLSSFVYVLDWQGNPKMKYELDQKVRSIAIDKDKKVLYAASYEYDLPQLIKYEL